MMNTPPLLDRAAVQQLAAELCARDKWPRTALLAIQQQRLDSILAHAVSASRYYRDALGSSARAGALQDLPVLTKTTLMDQWERLVTPM
jgi:hypothetical protein